MTHIRFYESGESEIFRQLRVKPGSFWRVGEGVSFEASRSRQVEEEQAASVASHVFLMKSGR